MTFINVGAAKIEYERINVADAEGPTLVMLHEGLGSVSMWNDFPGRLARATRCNVVVYSRLGHGRSSPIVRPRDVRYMHDEGLQGLPQFLSALEIEWPILLGHSDGGSIALIHGGGGRAVAGVIVLAPHVMVEELSVASIATAKVAFESGDLRARLARYHDHVDSMFRAWSDIWLHPAFRTWNIEEYLPRIPCPILAIQGEDDQYGTMEQIERIARASHDTELLKLRDCGHSAHRDHPEAVLKAVTNWIEARYERKAAVPSKRSGRKGFTR